MKAGTAVPVAPVRGRQSGASVTLHDLKSAQRQKTLADRLWKAGVTIVVGMTGGVLGPVEIGPTLAAEAAEVRVLRLALGPDSFETAFDRFWRERSSGYRTVFERGLDPELLRAILWQWASTGELPPAALPPGARGLTAVAAGD